MNFGARSFFGDEQRQAEHTGLMIKKLGTQVPSRLIYTVELHTKNCSRSPGPLSASFLEYRVTWI